MLNFRSTLIVFLIILGAFLITDYYLRVSPWIYIGIIIAFITLLTYGSICIQAGFYLKSYCTGNTEDRSVALTFDDGPDDKYTPVVLDILKEKKIVAAFFIVGHKAESYPDLIKRMELEGHIIGGHSFSHHSYFDLLSAKKIKIELQCTIEIIGKITGRRMKFFRPPYGVTNPAVARAVHKLNCHSIGWSLKSKDTITQNTMNIMNRLKKHVKPGDIILFHDNRQVTVNVLKEFIEYLKQNDFNIRKLDSLLKIEAYENYI